MVVEAQILAGNAGYIVSSMQIIEGLGQKQVSYSEVSE